VLVGGKALAELPAGDGGRYRAFISYSHRDASFGKRLHRRLEAYALPHRLVGRQTPQGTVPKKLAPIFRDREELAAAHDLSAEVRAALKESRCLIVVCSPASAASKWVGREIELFRELHPDRPILAAVRGGEPQDCFPPGLLGQDATGKTIEPLAADFRRGGDGEHLGLLKLVAGILGLGLDELVQRDATRRNQRVTAVTAAALAGMIVMGVLTAFALNARQEAERQRGEAEGLIEYMLTDLRSKLEGVGRLDVMTAVNKRALKYYSDQDIEKLPADSLERRARLFHAIGEDDEARGDTAAALEEFREARRTTAALVAEAPNDPERIFAQAQSEFYFGQVDYERHNYAAAMASFRAYKTLADRMVAIAPKNTKYRREAGYAESNLCSIAIQSSDRKGALQHCADALMQTQEAAGHPDKDNANDTARKVMAGDVMNCLGNLGDAYWINRDTVRARAQREAERKILDREMAADPQNMDLVDTWIALQIAFAEIDSDENHIAEAEARMTNALRRAEALYRFDPTVKRSAKQREFIEQELTRLRAKPRK
jgi:tetratricopeptide (TPR) repeat protein